MPGGLANLFGVELVEGNRIFVGAVTLGVRSSEVLVGIGVAMNAPDGGMGETRVNRDILALGL